MVAISFAAENALQHSPDAVLLMTLLLLKGIFQRTTHGTGKVGHEYGR
jgi:hypothetical protein